MSFLTYKDARPWAKAMKTAVVTGKMPPWFADPKYGHFANNPTLSVKDVDALVTWADNGAPEGDAKDKPAPATFQDGWNIKPDMIIEMPKEFHVPAKGTINYQNILVKVNFPEDKWVVAAEMRPGNPQVVHHMRGDIRGPNSHWMADAIPGEAYESGDDVMNKNDEGENLLGKFNPGLGAQEFSEEGAAKFVPKGSDFVFNIHYTAIGKPTTDRSRIGLVFAKQPPSVRYYTANVPLALNLVIPPGENNAEVVGEVTLQTGCEISVRPASHARSRQGLRIARGLPDGRDRYNYERQMGFQLATRIRVGQTHVPAKRHSTDRDLSF